MSTDMLQCLTNCRIINNVGDGLQAAEPEAASVLDLCVIVESANFFGNCHCESTLCAYPQGDGQAELSGCLVK